jgi:hypothetical protein
MHVHPMWHHTSHHHRWHHTTHHQTMYHHTCTSCACGMDTKSYTVGTPDSFQVVLGMDKDTHLECNVCLCGLQHTGTYTWTWVSVVAPVQLLAPCWTTPEDHCVASAMTSSPSLPTTPPLPTTTPSLPTTTPPLPLSPAHGSSDTHVKWYVCLCVAYWVMAGVGHTSSSSSSSTSSSATGWNSVATFLRVGVIVFIVAR